MKPLDSNVIAWSVHLACLLEVTAEKPGNVSWRKGFRDMRFIDFMASAVAIGPAMRDAPRSPVGETILRAVRDTRRFVETNTNLGMVLLLAPLAKAAGQGHHQGFRSGVRKVLDRLTVEDARLAYEAIRLASPGGLGRSDSFDVRDSGVDVTLLEAMTIARERDAVSREYATGFEITFEIGCPALQASWRDGHAFSDAIVQTALTILAEVPDTLIARKEGVETAHRVSERAKRVLGTGGAFSRPGREALKAFDQALRDEDHRLNPGTTADLTTASIFVFLIGAGGIEHFQDLVQRW